MSRIPCLIPLRDGHKLIKEVYGGLYNQTIDLDIITLSRPRLEQDKVITTDGQDVSRGYLSQAEARNLLVEGLKSWYDGEYVYMQDNDVVLTDSEVLQKAIDFLAQNKKIGSVHFDTKTYNPFKDIEKYIPISAILDKHIPMSAILIRREVLFNMTFKSKDPGTCNCYSLMDGVRNQGYECQFLPGDKPGHELI